MESNLYTWLTFILPPITGILGWVTSRHTRKSDTIQKMQESIDLLVKKNTELYEQVTALRAENAELKASNAELVAGQKQLKREIEKIKKA